MGVNLLLLCAHDTQGLAGLLGGELYTFLSAMMHVSSFPTVFPQLTALHELVCAIFNFSVNVILTNSWTIIGSSSGKIEEFI